jgi:hypothetical protein
MDDFLRRCQNAFSEKNPLRLQRPGTHTWRTLYGLFWFSVASVFFLLSPFVGVYAARIVNPHYNCTSYWDCEVHCFSTPGYYGNDRGILAACGGMGFLAYIALALIFFLSVIVWRRCRRIYNEVYFAMYPELYISQNDETLVDTEMSENVAAISEDYSENDD